MIPLYKMEDGLAVHYWDCDGRHSLTCKHPFTDNCKACRRIGAFDCLYLTLGEMTRWPETVHKLTLAEQAEALLLDPDLAWETRWGPSAEEGDDDTDDE